MINYQAPSRRLIVEDIGFEADQYSRATKVSVLMCTLRTTDTCDHCAYLAYTQYIRQVLILKDT